VFGDRFNQFVTPLLRRLEQFARRLSSISMTEPASSVYTIFFM